MPRAASSNARVYRLAPGLVLGLGLLGGAAPAGAHTRTATYGDLDLTADTLVWSLRARSYDLLDPLHLPPAAGIAAVIANPNTVGYLGQKLTVTAGGAACTLTDRLLSQDANAPEPTVLARFHFSCPAGGGELLARYDLFFDLDELHTGFARVALNGTGVATHIFRAGARDISIARPRSVATEMVQYLMLGIEHIFLGYDHLAFLAALLLGVTLATRGRRGDANPGVAAAAAPQREAVVSTLKIVTAFTAAHSLTLIAAALRPGLVPTAWVEPAIALSVACVAIENLWPRVPRRRWLVAFAFGLVHGFGFASVLREIGLPRDGLVRSLLAFNAGVELGQLAVVGVILPLLIGGARRNATAYERWVLRPGSLALGSAGLCWFILRV